MAATYKSFLANPSSSMLADDASLHYLTTTTSFRGADEIIKHLNDSKQVQRKGQDVINIIDGQSTIAVEVNTGIQFKTGGGVYLPGVDDAFLSAETMQLPIMHIVSFNAEGKISQIRQQWDQGMLLKQAEVIGKSGRNWPIRDCKEQLTFIQACLKSSGPAPAQPKTRSQTPTNPRGGVLNAMGDPHASLQLFGSREEIESIPLPEVRTPYAGRRPKQRAPTDFITDTPQFDDNTPVHSPSKAGMRELQPIRIFDGQEEYIEPEEDEKPKEKLPHIRAHPLKYKHFDFDLGSEDQSSAAPSESPYTTHNSQWSFEDFTKPVANVPIRGMRQQDVNDRDAQPRKTNGASNGTPGQHNILGAFEDPSPTGHALGNITNFNGRGKDFAADESPIYSSPSKGTSNTLNKAFQKLDINGNASDETSASRKENIWAQQGKTQEEQRIHIAGDGMGGRKGTARDFLSGNW